MKSLVCAFALALALAFTGPAFASPTISLSNAASPITPVQNYENQELWRDLQTGQTPPEAAVGKEGQTPKEWERATNQTDWERAAGLWDATNNRCSERR
jgi:hypothetical protein